MKRSDMKLLNIHWPLVVQQIYPEIEEIPRGGAESIRSLLSTWRGPYAKPTEAQIEQALAEVLAQLEHEQSEAKAEPVDVMEKIRDLEAQIAALKSQVEVKAE